MLLSSWIKKKSLYLVLSSPPQGVEGVPVPHGPENPLHDQLASAASAGHHPAHCLLVPGGLDICRLSECGQEDGSH